MKNRNWKAWLQRFAAMSCIVSMLSVNLLSVCATDDVDKLEEETSSLKSELSSLQEDLNSLTDEITTLTRQIEDTNDSIEKAELDLVAAKLNEEMQYDAMKKRIKYMYETGNPSFIEMVCDSESMSEFLNKSEFVQTITEYDKNLLQELKIIRVDITAKEEKLEEQQEELEEMQNELDEQQEELTAAISSTKGKLKSSSEALTKAKAAQKAAKEAMKNSSSSSSNKTTTSKSDSNKNSSSNSSTTQDTSSDLVLFAALLQCEAGTSNYDSLLAVATVVMNRVESSRFPNTIRGVIYQSGQFSPTWNGSLKRVLSKGPCSLAYQVAQDAMNGKRLGKVADCHYFNATWATSHNGVTVGGNIFW